MRVMGVETATSVGGVALIEEDRLVGEYTLDVSLSHSEKLMLMIDALLGMAGWKLEEVNLFSVSLGPGSFTGIRVGVCTVKGLARVLEKPVVGVMTLEGLAFNIQEFSGDVCPLIDAHQGRVYAALYREGEKLISEQLIFLNDLLEKLLEPTIFLGDGAYRYRQLIAEKLRGKARWVPPSLNFPNARNIAYLGWQKARQKENSLHWRNIQPYYLRRPDAEIKWEERT